MSMVVDSYVGITVAFTVSLSIGVIVYSIVFAFVDTSSLEVVVSARVFAFVESSSVGVVVLARYFPARRFLVSRLDLLVTQSYPTVLRNFCQSIRSAVSLEF